MNINYKFYATLLDAFVWYQADEWSADPEKNFIDKINRVPISEPASLKRVSKGSALNDGIDNLLKSKTIEVSQSCSFSVNGFDFDFPKHIVNDLLQRFSNSIIQPYFESQIRDVLHYGYGDYLREDEIIDLKTTSKYEIGKYNKSMQRFVYPLICNLNQIEINKFTFVATDGKSIFPEHYEVDIKECQYEVEKVENGIKEFLQLNKTHITDKKIFALI